jgi:hypothetical protein
MTFKEASDLLAVLLERIARVVGKTYGTVLAYRTGDRIPPADVRVRLAAFMREHSASLLRAADELDPPK